MSYRKLTVFPLLALFATLTLPTATLALELRGSMAEGHDRYIAPVSNPLFNETPYITTEVRPIYMYQEIPSDFPSEGGEINLIALELRLALTERLGLIATKDGWADIDFDANLPDENGFANISLGVKYALVSMPETDSIVSVGLEYEAPLGNLETAGIDLQGEGDGFLDTFITGATACGKVGLQGSAGLNLALDDDHDTSMLHYAVHADYEVLPWLFPLVELNGFTSIDHGRRNGFDFEGVDLVNFGSRDSGTVISIAGGARFRLSDHVQLGFAFETPITDREDLLDWRMTTDAVLSM